MPAIVRLLDNTPRSDGTIESKLSVSVAGGYQEDFTRARVELKSKNRALLHNGYPKAFRKEGVGRPSIEVVSIEQTDDALGRNTYYVVTEISGATEYHG